VDFATMKQVAPAKVAGPSQAERLVDVSPVLVGALLNEALHKVERAALWKFSEAQATLTIPAGSQVPSAPPADLAVPLMARNLDARVDLTFHDERQRFHHDDDPTGRQGTVTEYGVWAGALRFFPTAAAETSISLRYYKRWPDMVADADVPPFPETWHDLLTDYAAAKLALRLQPVAGKFLPSSAAEPFQVSWENGLMAMLQSDLVMPTWDAVENHALVESQWLGEGRDW
jgi:hypothetical protein